MLLLCSDYPLLVLYVYSEYPCEYSLRTPSTFFGARRFDRLDVARDLLSYGADTTLRYPRVPQSTPEYPGYHQSTIEDHRIPQSTPDYPRLPHRVPQSTPSTPEYPRYPRVPRSTSGSLAPAPTSAHDVPTSAQNWASWCGLALCCAAPACRSVATY